jgi:hypothetical protein
VPRSSETLVSGTGPCIEFWGRSDRLSWEERGLNDKLYVPGHGGWTHLTVLRADIERLWPFGSGAPPHDQHEDYGGAHVLGTPQLPERPLDQPQPLADVRPAAAASDAGKVEAVQPKPCWRIKDGKILTPGEALVFETVKELWPHSDYTGTAPNKRIGSAMLEKVGAKHCPGPTVIKEAKRKFYFGPPQQSFSGRSRPS